MPLMCHVSIGLGSDSGGLYSVATCSCGWAVSSYSTAQPMWDRQRIVRVLLDWANHASTRWEEIQKEDIARKSLATTEPPS